MTTDAPCNLHRAERRPWQATCGAIRAVVWKDLAAELRSRELLSSMLVFALLVILIFNFALELDAEARASGHRRRAVGDLRLCRHAGAEPLDGDRERPRLPGRAAAGAGGPQRRFTLARRSATWSSCSIVEAIVLPVYSILYNVNLFQPGLLLVILLGSVGYVAVGTLLASMAVQTRTRDILLPILLFPVVLPVLIAAVKASTGILQALPMGEIWPWLNLLIVYDVIFTAVAFMVFDYVVEE